MKKPASCYGKLHIERAIAAFAIRIPIEQVLTFAIHQQFQFLAGDFSERIRVAHVAFADGRDLERVFAIGWKLMLGDNSAARAEGHAFDVVILRGVFGNAIRLRNRRGHVAHRNAADLTRCRHVTFEQRG